MNMDAQMANDLVAMMEPVTKYAAVAMTPESLLRTLRRAIKIAATPPMGPVYVCVPMDVLDAINEEQVFPSCIPSTRVLPPAETIRETANILINAKKPVIFIGDGVAYSKATGELQKVAELLGAEVYGVDFGDFIMDNSHPLYQGTTGHMFASYSAPILQKGDVNFIIGTYMVPEVFPEVKNIFADSAKVIHYDLNAYEIAKNHRVDLGVVCDPKLSLAALALVLEEIITPERKKLSEIRIEEFSKAKKIKFDAEVKADQNNKGVGNLHMHQFTEVLSRKLPADAIIFDESLTNSASVTRYNPPSIPGSYFVTRGGSLGVGFPGAIGVKFANLQKTVIGFSGDGGSMYTIQVLWSAIRHNVGVKFVVCNNGSYKLLQLNIDTYWKERSINQHAYPLPFDLSFPQFRFDLIAKSMGVEAVRVEKEEDIEKAIEMMLADDKPFLIDLVLEGNYKHDAVQMNCSH
jgi:benzoylformate decarboxylase